MVKYIIKRLGYGILVLIGVLIVVFLLFNVLPGDPAKMMLGQRNDVASAEAIRHDLGLDQPLSIQFLGYLNDVSPLSFYRHSPASFFYYDSTKYKAFTKLNLGGSLIVIKSPYLRRSYQTKRDVTDLLLEAFPQTALLTLVSILFAIVVGIAIGIFCALYKDSLFDKASIVISVFGMSLPSFFAAILFAWIFAYLLADFTGLNMFGSLYTVDDFGNGEHLDLKNLILPAFTLGIRPLAIVVELTRSATLETLSQDYVRTAYAKGLSKFSVVWRHVIKNSLNPIVTAVSGWLASLMAGAVFIEYIFDWKGVGIIIVNALEKYDFPVLMGALLFISVILVFINIFVDIIYGVLDPKIRLS